MSIDRPLLLIVDDEPAIRDSLRSLLSRRLPEIEVVVAADARSALELMERQSVDILLTDHRMEGMTGVQLAAVVARRWPATRRLIMTAYADLDVTTRAINEGHVAHFLTKPIGASELVRAVAELVATRRMERERALELASRIEALRLAGTPGA